MSFMETSASSLCRCPLNLWALLTFKYVLVWLDGRSIVREPCETPFHT